MKMKELLFSIAFSLIAVFGFAQITIWDGGGDGTSWNDPINWNTDLVPQFNDQVSINANVTITGTVPNNPSQVIIGFNKTVTLDLDLMVGDGAFNKPGYRLRNNSILNLGIAGNNRMFKANIKDNRLFTNLTGGETGTVNIAPSTTLDIMQALDGIASDMGNIIVVNDGTIDISVKREAIALKAGSSLTNNGVISIVMPGTGGDGIDNFGTITNNVGGVITITDANVYSIHNQAGAVFNNYGTINSVELTATKGAMLNEGTFLNGQCGKFTTNNGDKIEQFAGSFINDGLIVSGPNDNKVVTQIGGTAINNGFFKYKNGFSTFGTGTFTDNGINVNKAADLIKDAGSSCTVADLGIDAGFDWYSDAANTTQVGTSDAVGALNFDAGAFAAAGSYTIYTCYGADVAFTVNNLDGACTMPLAPPPVPTLSQWGLIVLGLMMMIMMTLTLSFSTAKEGALVTSTGAQASAKFSVSKLPFNGSLFARLVVFVFAAVIAIFAVAVAGFGYELTGADPYGSLVATGLVAYLLMLLKLENKK